MLVVKGGSRRECVACGYLFGRFVMRTYRSLTVCGLLLVACSSTTGDAVPEETSATYVSTCGSVCVQPAPPRPRPKCGLNPDECASNFNLAVRSHETVGAYWSANLLTLKNKVLAARSELSTGTSGYEPTRFSADVAANVSAAISGSHCMIDRGLEGIDRAGEILSQAQEPVDVCTTNSQAYCDEYASSFDYPAYIAQTNTAQYVEGLVTKPYTASTISHSVLPPIKALMLNPKNATAKVQLTKALSFWRGATASKACFSAQ
jgi:hypothetical protein